MWISTFSISMTKTENYILPKDGHEKKWKAFSFVIGWEKGQEDKISFVWKGEEWAADKVKPAFTWKRNTGINTYKEIWK